jgi:predicted O-linked N-acetylglucosamine transferase (SPINDLY family)
VRLVCAQFGQKLLPEQDALFAELLARAPDADLTLLTGLQHDDEHALGRRMRPAFAARGVDFDTRVRLLGYVSETEFLTETWQADLVLDALHWSGGNTALETLWGDVPILTLPGEFMRGRHTAAMLDMLDLPELIARDRDDYLAKAAALVTDRDARQRLRRQIGERKHRLYRDRRVVDAFAALIEREVRQRLA